MTKEQFLKIVEYIDSHKEELEFNDKLFNITEGDLAKYVSEELRKQLSPNSANKASLRMAPVNVWNKIISKLSKIYIRPVTRLTENASDQEIIDYYVGEGIDQFFQDANENYNTYKWSGLELYEDYEVEELKVRSIPSNSFLMLSDDPVNSLNPTMYIKLMGKERDIAGVERRKIYIYTDENFYPIYDNGEIVGKDQVEGNVNPYGMIPFEYVSMSKYLLVPKPDIDTLKMTTLFPVLFTDQNYGSMYLSYPLVYTLDAAEGELPASPNLVYDLKSENPDKQAQIGVVKAEPNLAAQMNHVKELLATWLDSRDIRPGAIGKLQADNFASGIAKLIAESDTLENRKKQEIKFAEYENRFWKRLAHIHNILAEAGRVTFKAKFSDPENLTVDVTYSEETVHESREAKIKRLQLERDSRFRSTRSAIKELNPKMTDEQITEMMIEIENEFSQTMIESEDDTE